MGYSPFYYCAGCGKKLGTKSHDVIDQLGEAHYDDAYCRDCEDEELAFLDMEANNGVDVSGDYDPSEEE